MSTRDQTPATDAAGWLWIGLAAPGAIWLIVLFVVPFYVMLAVAGGGVNEFFQTLVPIWNPLHWSSWNFSAVWHDIVRQRRVHRAAGAADTDLHGDRDRDLARDRLSGRVLRLSPTPVRRKALFLVLLVAPFWVSYMMRMLAWIDLLQQGGIFNSALSYCRSAGEHRLARRQDR